jgi:probable rRNA maturation factor
MNRVIVQDSNGRKSLLLKRIEKILLRSLTGMKQKNAEVVLTFITDPEMKKLNHKYRKKNKTTDVLSFGQDDYFNQKRKVLGDILISKTKAKKQAKAAGHRLIDEYRLLAIHGLLHLLGYDHERIKDEVVMFTLQKKLIDHAKKI